MPVPKKNYSRTRQAKRRAHWKIEAPVLSVCPACAAPVLPYNVCSACGQYQGKQFIKIKEKKSKKEK
jgi:large subunit ribosomal protein L32